MALGKKRPHCVTHQKADMRDVSYCWYWSVGHMPVLTDVWEDVVVPKEQIQYVCSKTWIAREFVMRLLGPRAQIDLDWSQEVGQGGVGCTVGCHKLPLLVIRGIRITKGVGPPRQQPIAARFPTGDLSLTHSITRSRMTYLNRRTLQLSVHFQCL